MLELRYKPTVFVAMPSATGFPYPEAIINVFNQSCADEVNLIFSSECVVKREPVQNARNKLVKLFLSTNATHLWFLDDDNPPALDVLENLLKAEKDMVSALVPLRRSPHLNVFINDAEGNPQHVDTFDRSLGEVQEIDNCGTGCVLMTRELVKAAYLKEDGQPYQFEYSKHVCTLDGKVIPYEFQDRYEKDWKKKYKTDSQGNILTAPQYVSEDLRFGRIVKSLGFRIYCHIYSTCYHFTGDTPNKRIDRLTLYRNTDPKAMKLLQELD